MTGLIVAALLTVIVQNTAAVPDDVLASTQVELDRMLAAAHITIAWVKTVEPDTFRIQVVLRRTPAGGPGAMAPSALGTTVGDDHASGGSCFVFYERVLKFAHQHNRPAALILAFAIAHEFGHVLLPAPAHALSGVMKAEWSDDDVRHLVADERVFSLDQASLMTAAIEARGGIKR